MITPSVRHQLPHIPLCGITITPASTSPCTRPSHVKAVGRSFRPSATNTDGAVLPARRMFLPASRPSADLNILKIIIQSRAGGMCPLKPIWRDRPRTSVSAKRGGCGSASRPPDLPWLRTWDQPRGPMICYLGTPWRFPFNEWRVVQDGPNDDCRWRNEPAQPVSHRPPLRMRVVVCHYPQPYTWHHIVAEPTCHLPQSMRDRRFCQHDGAFTEFAERVESTSIGSRQGSAAWEGKRAVLREVRARLAALDNTAKGRPYRWHRPGHGKTWRPQVTTPLWLGTPSQRTPRPTRRHQSLAPVSSVAPPAKPGPVWEVNDVPQVDSEDSDLTSLVGETAASEASTRLGIRRLLQRQQPPERQSRRLMPHSRSFILPRPAEGTSRVRPPCRMQPTAAFYSNRRPKRLLLERGCTDGTGPRPSLEP